MFDFPIGSPIALAPSTRYWIQLSSTDESGSTWAWSTDVSGPGVAGEFFANSGGVFPNDPDGPYQMRVSGTASVVPEPSTASLALGLFSCGALMLRRRIRGGLILALDSISSKCEHYWAGRVSAL